MTPLVALSDVGYAVGDAQLLHGVAVTVNAGELVAVIGPNGAGKSTLLRVIAADLEPTTGSVALAGQPATSLDVAELARLRAVYVPGGVTDNPFTVREVVTMGGYSTGKTDGAAAAMEAMDVAALAGRSVGTLSGGEHTRVALARVLTQETPLILLDEPLTSLDVAHEQRVLRHLRHLAAAGRGILAVFHDLNAAAAYADRFVLMAAGRVVAEGTAADVLTTRVLTEVYGHPMTVTQMGSRPVVLPDL